MLYFIMIIISVSVVELHSVKIQIKDKNGIIAPSVEPDFHYDRSEVADKSLTTTDFDAEKREQMKREMLPDAWETNSKIKGN